MMTEITPELAEICGIHAGDGYMRCRESGKGEVQICGSLEEKDYYDNHVIPLFNKCFSLEIKGKIFSQRTYGFISYEKRIRDFLLESGFPPGKKSNSVCIPKEILESKDNSIIYGFLRGIFDTEGNLYFRKSFAGIDTFKKKYNHYPIIKITTTSKSLAEGIIILLHRLDILFFYFNRDSKKINESRQYIISISGLDGLEKWMNLIGTKNKVQLSRYLIWKKLGYCPMNTTLEQREEILKSTIN